MSTSSSANGISARTASITRRALSQRGQPSAWTSVTTWPALRVEATRGRRLCDAPDREGIGGLAHRQRALLVRPPGLGERAGDDVVQLRVDLGLLPEVLLESLHPLEVRDDDAACVREHVREDEDPPIVEDLVGLGSDRAVRALADDSRSDLVGVLSGDHRLESARREDVAVDEQELLVGDRLAAGQALQQTGLLLMGERGTHVDSVRVLDAPAGVRESDDGRALVGEDQREVGA